MTDSSIYKEIGSTGLEHWGGFISAAYNTKLTWPSVQPLYSRLRRSDPEIAMIRTIFNALASGVEFVWELQTEDPSDDDLRAQEFGYEVLAELDGGPEKLLNELINNVPFYGWGWWELIWGLRKEGWKPPDEYDEWQSQYNDGLIVPRRLAYRDTSSLLRWDMTKQGRVLGMVQQTEIGNQITLPIEKSLHITYGDPNNPEGLSPLEAVWRLERIKYGLEVVQGIGFEHAAGYLNVMVEGDLTASDKSAIKTAAKSIMSAQESNYAAWPGKVKEAGIMEAPFQAGAAILEAIRYYGILKLTVFIMQWMTLSSVSGSGSYAAMADSSSMFVLSFNAMLAGFAKQIDQQLGKRLFEVNQAAFPNLTARPKLMVTPIEKSVDLGDLSQFADAMETIYGMNPADQRSFRRKAGFLEIEPQPDEDAPEQDQPEQTQEEIDQAVDEMTVWAKEHDPKLYKLLTK